MGQNIKNRANKSNTNKNRAVIYARYSSRAQNAQTIAGQKRFCTDWATQKGLIIVREYVDEAISGRTAKRPEFQKMIADAQNGNFDYVIVFAFDRFSRNRCDHVVYKRQLNECGVKVLSATESFGVGDGESSIFFEAFSEASSEEFVLKLSKRISCAFQDNLERDYIWGGTVLTGYKIENRKYVIDEKTAPAIRYLFNQIVAEVPVKKIYDELNSMGYRTKKGKPLSIQSCQKAIRNERYCGIYHDKDGNEYPNRFPAIVSKELYYRAQNVLDRKKYSNGSGNAKANYLLSGKAFCGYCGERMIGISATSQNGDKHYYYNCGNRSHRKSCHKENEPKDALEKLVVAATVKTLFSDDMTALATRVSVEFEKRIGKAEKKRLNQELREIENEFDRYTELLLKTTSPSIIDSTNEKCRTLELRKANAMGKLDNLRIAAHMPYRKSEVIRHLKRFTKGDINDPKYRQRIINNLISCVYVYDDKIQIFFSIITNEKIEFSDLPKPGGGNIVPATRTPNVRVQHTLVHQNKIIRTSCNRQLFGFLICLN